MEEKQENIVDKIDNARVSTYQKVSQYTYYILIGVISLVVVIFLPMVGSDAGLGWNFPTTTSGWIVFAVSRASVAFLNLLIFSSFMNQGKLNIKDNPKYKEATEILIKVREKEKEIPKSPHQWYAKQYSRKGVSIFLGSALAVVAFTQAVLTYDFTVLMTYACTLIMGLVFGIMQMKKTEAYWTEEFYRYAIMIKNKSESTEKVEVSAQAEEGDKKC